MSPILLFAIPFFFIGILLEYLFSNRKELSLYSREDFWSNIRVAIFTALMRSTVYTFYVFLYYQAYEQLMPLREELLGYSSVPLTSYFFLVGILLDDFGYYWFHRLSHQIRLLWACHVVHHSSDHYNLSVGLRNSGFAVFYEPLFYLLLPILGFHPVMVLACRSVNIIYQFFCHTQVETPWDRLEPLLVTPKLHAVHHGQNEECIDKNYAGIFCFYDQIFDTYQPSALREELRFGVTNPPPSSGVIDVNLHEWRSIGQDMGKQRSWWMKLCVIFKGPSWKPGAMNSKRLKRKLKAKRLNSYKQAV